MLVGKIFRCAGNRGGGLAPPKPPPPPAHHPYKRREKSGNFGNKSGNLGKGPQKKILDSALCYYFTLSKNYEYLYTYVYGM